MPDYRDRFITNNDLFKHFQVSVVMVSFLVPESPEFYDECEFDKVLIKFECDSDKINSNSMKAELRLVASRIAHYYSDAGIRFKEPSDVPFRTDIRCKFFETVYCRSDLIFLRLLVEMKIGEKIDCENGMVHTELGMVPVAELKRDQIKIYDKICQSLGRIESEKERIEWEISVLLESEKELFL